MSRGEHICIQGFGGGSLTETDHSEYLGVDTQMILTWMGQEDVDWIHVAQDTAKW
jgi:hypothetical protein